MTDALVSGRSLAALQTALDLAEVGLSVIVAGAVARDTPNNRDVRDADGHVAAFIERIAQPLEGAHGRLAGTELTQFVPEPPLLRSAKGRWLPQTEPNLLGIPAVPLASAVIKFVGTATALRAFLDRITPVLTVGKTRLFAHLVRKRIGRQMLMRLVEPHVLLRFGRPAAEVEVAMAAPGLNETMSRTGSLTSAVLAYADRNVSRETRVVPSDGWEVFRQALLRKLEWYGVHFTEAVVESAERAGDEWSVELSDGSRVHARSLVLDAGADPMHGSSSLLVSPLMSLLQGAEFGPSTARLHAEAEVEQPEWLPDNSSGVHLWDHWSVHLRHRLIEGDRSQTQVRLVSRADDLTTYAQMIDDPLALSDMRETFAAALRHLGMQPPGATDWKLTIAAAPFATIAEREEAKNALESQRQVQPTVLSVGRSLHGNDLGAALEHAHAGAVRLRRVLLGLEEADN